MTTIAFESISTTTRLPSGTTYSYVHVKPSGNHPYILFCHGFPSSSYDWRHQISFFSKQGYGIIAPDLLGYGGTDKPKELEAYRMKTMCTDMVSILDAVGVEKVLVVGHDCFVMGSFLVSRLANFFPEHFHKFVFLDIAYQAPAGHFNLDAVNDMTEKMLGYPIFGYWYFFNAADAAELIDRNDESSASLWFCAGPKSVKENLCLRDGTRAWFTEGKTGPYGPWISKEEVVIHKKIFNADSGGYGPPLNWYKAQLADVNDEDESSIAPDRQHIQQPTLLITCNLDPIAICAIQEQGMRPFVRNLKVEELEVGHWLQLEKRDEVNQLLKAFFEEE